jgi:hypothetical protein
MRPTPPLGTFPPNLLLIALPPRETIGQIRRKFGGQVVSVLKRNFQIVALLDHCAASSIASTQTQIKLAMPQFLKIIVEAHDKAIAVIRIDPHQHAGKLRLPARLFAKHFLQHFICSNSVSLTFKK